MSLEPKSTSTRATGVHVALALLSLSVALFLVAQIANNSQQGKVLNWQIDTTTKQIKATKDNSFQYAQYITQQDTLLKQTNEVQAQYQKLLDDLLKLSEEDADAKEVITKWKIARNNNAAPAADTKPAEKP